jgi:FkbM family methyltransferase
MNYLIDCGTNLFFGLNHLNNVFNFNTSWKIDCFEANPLIYEEAIRNYFPKYDADISFFNKAVWVHNDFVEVNINELLPLDNGSNILKNPPPRDIVYNRDFKWSKKIKVPSVRLADLIRNADRGRIVVKIDVEGAEFEILKDLIEENLLNKIDVLYVEFHDRFFLNELEKYSLLKQELIVKIKSQVKIFKEWD